MNRSIALWTAMWLLTGWAGARSLEPDQILIVANDSNPASLRVARHYQQRRNIPSGHLVRLPLSAPLADSIGRDEYESRIAEPSRKFLKQPAFAGRIKCLVTTYGLPYRIEAAGPLGPDRASDETLRSLERMLRDAGDRLETLTLELAKLNASTDSGPAPTGSVPQRIQAVERQFEEVRRRLAVSGADRNAIDTWIELYRRFAGLGAALQTARQSNWSWTPPSVTQASVAEHVQAVRTADVEDRSFDRRLADGYYDSMEKAAGVRGLMLTLTANLDEIRGRETGAALDSELSMLLFDSYSLYRWRPNELKQRLFWTNVKTLMVSRLDGPSERIATGLVDKALEAEAQGLKGAAYVDMRYENQGGSSMYYEYDRSLKKMAEFLRRETDLKVVEEQSPSLFAEGACPDTALYSGWYSLRKYIDAFDYMPGAVGFHIASFEAVDLRSDTTRQWVPAMLRDGITATIGPVDEPYLSAFPRPDEFFRQLVNGRCLVEAYYRTKPFNSWQMLLIGDPLYTPFPRD